MKDKVIAFFDFVIYWTIVLIPFAMAIAPAPVSVLFGWLAFSFLMKRILKKQAVNLENKAILIPFLAMFIIACVSMINSSYYTASIRGLFKLVQYLFLFLIIAEELRDEKHARKIIVSMAAGIFLASADAAWQIFTGKDFIRGNALILNIGLKRATAAFSDANVLGVYLSAILPLIAALFLYYKEGKHKIIFAIVSAVALVGVILTFSRPTALAVYLSVLILALIRKDKLVIFLLILVLIILPFILPSNIKSWIKDTSRYGWFTVLGNTDRISIYKNSINMIKHHPIIGVGVNTFSKNYLKYKLPEPAYAQTGDAMYAHNNFLHMAGEIGLVGLVMFIWLLCAMSINFISVQKALKEGFLKVVHLGLGMSAIAFLINGLTETSLYYGRVCMIFWFLLGFMLAIARLSYEG